MNITFPHMGNLHIILKTLFTQLGCDVTVPPPNSKRTMDLGTKLSPETVCLPFKMTLGNYIEALECGADTIVACGGVGPCRFGYYAQVQKGILEQLGYKFEMIVIEPALSDVYKSLRKVAARRSWRQVYQAFRLAGAKMNLLDDLERAINTIRPRETERGTADALRKKAIAAIEQAGDVRSLAALRETILNDLKTIKLKANFTPLRVALVGEFYVMLDPFVNQDLERSLGYMGVEVDKTLYLSDYVQAHLLRRSDCLTMYNRLLKLAKPYLGHYVGGHGLKSIANTIFKKQYGYDGVIHVYPFTCMPEVIAKNILAKVSVDTSMPVLTVAYDEQTGETGTVTRLEAFIDLLKHRSSKFNRTIFPLDLGNAGPGAKVGPPCNQR